MLTLKRPKFNIPLTVFLMLLSLAVFFYYFYWKIQSAGDQTAYRLLYQYWPGQNTSAPPVVKEFEINKALSIEGYQLQKLVLNSGILLPRMQTRLGGWQMQSPAHKLSSRDKQYWIRILPPNSNKPLVDIRWQQMQVPKTAWPLINFLDRVPHL